MDDRNAAFPLSHSRILDLPRELRDEIYSYLLPSHTIDHPRVDARHSSLAAVMRTSKELYNEVRCTLYRIPTLIIVLWSNVRHHHSHRNGYLQTLPILQAQTLHIKIIFRGHRDTDAEPLGEHQQENAVEAEPMVSCLEAEVIALTAILRRRQHMPAIHVNFNFIDTSHQPYEDWLVGIVFFWGNVTSLLLPLRSLTRVPGGGVQVCVDRRLEEHPFWDVERRKLESGVSRDTSCTGARKTLTVEETRILHAHYGYLHAKKAYDAFEPWAYVEDFRSKGSAELRDAMRRAEERVRDFRGLRKQRVYEWMTESELAEEEPDFFLTYRWARWQGSRG